MGLDYERKFSHHVAGEDAGANSVEPPAHEHAW
jgi:hypothetical protein